MIGQHAFGSRLRTQRERRGVALAAIAESTKIKLSLLDALERGDLSQWPRGLFRRSYLREYAARVGIAAEPLLLEVERLFPEDGEPVREAARSEAAEPMRLSFPSATELATHRASTSAGAALVEWLGVALAGVGLAYLFEASAVTTMGLVALVYYPVALAATGRTLSSTRLQMLLRRVRASASGLTPRAHTVSTASPTPEAVPLYLVSRPGPSPATAQAVAGLSLLPAVGDDSSASPRSAVN